MVKHIFQVFANILTYFVSFLLIGFANSDFGADDRPMFRNLSLICCGIGLFFAIVFHVVIKEHNQEEEEEEVVESCDGTGNSYQYVWRLTSGSGALDMGQAR